MILDAKILNNIIMQIADGKISAGSNHRVFSDNDKEDGDALGLPFTPPLPPVRTKESSITQTSCGLPWFRGIIIINACFSIQTLLHL